MKTIFKKCILILLIIIPLHKANASLIITNWKTKVKITDYGEEVSINFKAKVQAPKNYYYKEWHYIFDKKMNVKILEASVKNRKHKVLFKNSKLIFRFHNAYNNEFLEFNFKYSYTNGAKNTKYLRQDYVYIPSFANGSNGSLKVLIPDDWEVYSSHPKFTINVLDNSFNWKGKVPKNGFSDIFKSTPKKARWKISIKNTIVSNEPFNDVDVQVPLYFSGGNHIIEDYKISTNKFGTKIEKHLKEEYIKAKFKNLDSRLAQVIITAIINNGYDKDYWTSDLNPSQFSSVDLKTSSKLSNIVNNIQNKNPSDNAHDYVKIAKWVHNYIEYDDSYIGREMSTDEILKEKRGVCVHYSLLYEKIMRTIGIPATAVSGFSYNTNDKKFEAHSWVLIYINGEWIPIDPTWGIYSGKLPVSHIFSYKKTNNPVFFKVYDKTHNLSNITMDISEEILFLK